MPKCLFITLSPLDNDSRVQKEINFFQNQVSSDLLSLSVNTKESFDFPDKCLVHQSRRVLGIPGLSALFFYIKFFRFAIKYRSVDLLHCNDLGGLLVGVFLKLSGSKAVLVYDSHEYAINDVPYESGWSIKLKYYLEKILIRFADEVITVSDSIANEYVRLYDIPKPHLVLNCPRYREQDKKNLFRENLSIRADQTIFLYQGAFAGGRGIELLLEAFSDLESDQNVIVFMGQGLLQPVIEEKANISDTIFFHPAVKPDVLLNYTSSANYGINFGEDCCLSYRFSLANKLFEYLMAGLPVLTSNLYEMKRFVETEGVGIVASENTVTGFKQAVKDSLRQDYGAIQQKVFSTRKKYSWEEQEKVLERVYQGYF